MNTVASANAAIVVAGSNRRRKVSADPDASVHPIEMKRPWAWWRGSAWTSTSSAPNPQASRRARALAARPACVRSAPLGRPVVPLV